MKIFKLIILVITIAATNIVFGQGDAETMMFGQGNISKNKEEKQISNSMDRYLDDITAKGKLVISPREVEEDFTGYTIRVKHSKEEALPTTDKIFKEFGKIKIDEDANENFIYLVGTFKKETLAYEYLLKIVSPRYPLASVMRYEKGEIVSK